MYRLYILHSDDNYTEGPSIRLADMDAPWQFVYILVLY